MMRAVGLLLVLPLTVGTAQTSPAHHQHFLLFGRVEAPSLTLVADGVINGIGTLAAESVEYQPADLTYRETDLAIVGEGRLTLSITGAFSTWPFTLDPRTCTQHGRLAGRWRITSGGGAFAGATGGGTFSGRFLTSAQRGTTGCDEAMIKGFVSGPMNGSLAYDRG